VLLKLSDNLANDPSNPKYQEFKSTNTTIQKALIQVAGGVEYAIAVSQSHSVIVVVSLHILTCIIDGFQA